MTSGMLAMPPCAMCGKPSTWMELVAPGELPADWEHWGQRRRDCFTASRNPDQWYLFYEGVAAGNGSGNHIGPGEAARILRGFREPYTYDQVHAAGLYDDAGPW
jgi:hypothetical protein